MSQYCYFEIKHIEMERKKSSVCIYANSPRIKVLITTPQLGRDMI